MNSLHRRRFLQLSAPGAAQLFPAPHSRLAAALRQKVKITDVKCMIVRGTWDWDLVKIETDAGLHGIGEAYWGPGVKDVITTTIRTPATCCRTISGNSCGSWRSSAKNWKPVASSPSICTGASTPAMLSTSPKRHVDRGRDAAGKPGRHGIRQKAIAGPHLHRRKPLHASGLSPAHRADNYYIWTAAHNPASPVGTIASAHAAASMRYFRIPELANYIDWWTGPGRARGSDPGKRLPDHPRQARLWHRTESGRRPRTPRARRDVVGMKRRRAGHAPSPPAHW